jgi:hypothetical protein
MKEYEQCGGRINGGRVREVMCEHRVDFRTAAIMLRHRVDRRTARRVVETADSLSPSEVGPAMHGSPLGLMPVLSYDSAAEKVALDRLRREQKLEGVPISLLFK